MEEAEIAAFVVDDNDKYDDVCEDNDADDMTSEIEDYENLEAMQELDEELFDSLNQMVLRLCSACAIFFKGRFDKEILVDEDFDNGWRGTYARLYHSSLVSLEQSVEYGCPVCHELYRKLQELRRLRPKLLGKNDDSFSIWCKLYNTEWWYKNSIKGLGASLILRDRNGKFLEGYGSGSIVRLPFYPAEALGLGPEFRDPAYGNTTASSALSTELARSWYHNCLRHKGCRNFDKSSACTPTRLVRVQESSHGASFGVTASLVETKDLPKDTPCHYVTLSHRWGGLSMTQLREGNFDAFRREIPVHQLPPLFQDALFMTYKLGVDYIWIDCLCIIQGSKADWTVEAMRMGDYYRFAECNLAASGYPDSALGLFGQREALPRFHYPIQLNLTLVEEGVEIQHIGLYVRADRIEFLDTITRGPLGSRGWIAQERALSPGVMHFTPKQIWWECNERVVNEAFPYIAMSWGSEFEGNGAIRSINAQTRREQTYLSWMHFVQSYAGADLTVETDRFPALAGIANIYASLLDDNLIAGIWESDLIPSLAWYPREKARRVPSVQLAPSWSWASVCMAFYSWPGEVISGVSVHQVLSDIPGFESDLNLPALEKSGVRGLLVRGPLRTMLPDLEGLSERFECVNSVHIKHDWNDFAFFTQYNISHEQKWRWQNPTHLLPLVFGWYNPYRYIFGLILRAVEGQDHPTSFRRLGTITLTLRPEAWEEVLGLRKEDGEYKPSLIFEECGLQDFVLI